MDFFYIGSSRNVRLVQGPRYRDRRGKPHPVGTVIVSENDVPRAHYGSIFDAARAMKHIKQRMGEANNKIEEIGAALKATRLVLAQPKEHYVPEAAAALVKANSQDIPERLHLVRQPAKRDLRLVTEDLGVYGAKGGLNPMATISEIHKAESLANESLAQSNVTLEQVQEWETAILEERGQLLLFTAKIREPIGGLLTLLSTDHQLDDKWKKEVRGAVLQLLSDFPDLVPLPYTNWIPALYTLLNDLQQQLFVSRDKDVDYCLRAMWALSWMTAYERVAALLEYISCSQKKVQAFSDEKIQQVIETAFMSHLLAGKRDLVLERWLESKLTDVANTLGKKPDLKTAKEKMRTLLEAIDGKIIALLKEGDLPKAA